MSSVIAFLHAHVVSSSRWRDDTGSVTVEYGGVIVLVVVMVVAAIGVVSKTDLMDRLFNAVIDDSIKDLVK
jgi:Flp pilus assembly pilin Flp